MDWVPWGAQPLSQVGSCARPRVSLSAAPHFGPDHEGLTGEGAEPPEVELQKVRTQCRAGGTLPSARQAHARPTVGCHCSFTPVTPEQEWVVILSQTVTGGWTRDLSTRNGEGKEPGVGTTCSVRSVREGRL